MEMSLNQMFIQRSKVPQSELDLRLKRFYGYMDIYYPSWETAVIFSKVNLYYFTGTMQDGMLLIRKGSEPVLWVRRSIERALDESSFPCIKHMSSFRDAALNFEHKEDIIHTETENVPLAHWQRFRKHFPCRDAGSLDKQISLTRAVKSEYELSIMKDAGKKHARVLEELVPGILREGMSEAEFAAELYKVMVKEGHQGVIRFAMYDTEVVMGNMCFGESSIYPSYFDGPGGLYGMSAAVPVFASRERKLKKGDLVYVDVAFGSEGYHTDKTMTYVFGGKLPEDAVKIHKQCVEIQDRTAEMLKPGEIPENIYKKIMDGLDAGFIRNFMGFGERQAKFLGHGIGLHVDEWPVIAKGFKDPLQEGMVFALEPKKGIENIGMVGIENTFIVTPEGGQCITGGNKGLIQV